MSSLLNHRYKILKALGEGGFGKTFLAEDTQLPSRRHCVIKQLKLPSAQSDIVQLVKDRFAREAAVLESVSKGNHQVPDLYAYFLADNQFYLIQEWIEGKSLGETVPPAWPEMQVISFLQSVLPALALVHQHKIIHRDIKPENIILRQSDRQPCLIDFGAVKEMMNTVVVPIAPEASIVIGTAGFMAPEQASGRPTFASDLYSLAMTAIFLLTGRSPQEIPIDSSTGQVLWQQYAPSVTALTAALITRAISLNPQARYATATDMLAALNQPVSTPSTSATPKSASLAPTSPTLVPPTQRSSESVLSSAHSWKKPAVITLLSVVGIGAIALTTPLFQSDSPINSTANSKISSRKTSTDNSAPEEDSIESLSADIERAESQVAEINKAILEKDRENAALTPSSVALIAQADRYHARATKLYEEGRESLALQDIASALALDAAATEALVLKGDILINQSRPDLEGAIAAYTRALNAETIGSKTIGSETKDPETTDILSKRCSTYAKLQDWINAQADCDRGLALDSTNTELYAQRADIFMAQTRFEQAEQDYTTAIDINDRNGIDDRSLYFRRAKAREQLRDFQGGIEDFERVKAPE